MVLFAVLVGDGAFDRACANAFQSMMPSNDYLVGLRKFMVAIYLILQSENVPLKRCRPASRARCH